MKGNLFQQWEIDATRLLGTDLLVGVNKMVGDK